MQKDFTRVERKSIDISINIYNAHHCINGEHAFWTAIIKLFVNLLPSNFAYAITSVSSTFGDNPLKEDLSAYA